MSQLTRVLTEAQLQEQIITLCRLYKLWWYHPYDSRRSVSGWPDLVILGQAAIFAELKSADGRRSTEQIRCAGRLAAAGLTYRLWRPDDWESGIIRTELEGLR